MNTKLILIYFILFSFIACNAKQDKQKSTEPIKTETAKVVKLSKTPLKENFKSYWYSGKAELSSYNLKQSRYGEIRNGEVVLIFVTEPFSLSKQVKLDRPKDAGEDNVSVMKLNHVRKFNTGVYDYSIVTSTFTPIDFMNHPYTLKSTTSIQEWCGHTFTQLNLDGNTYNFKQFSYFESDGDEEHKLEVAFLEEDLMTRIRINNGQLPGGEIDLIPSTISSRFTHKKMQVSKAIISKTELENTINYTIKYTSIPRTLTIEVEHEFPYKIMGWTENDGDGLITTAKLKASLQEPYWNQKSIKDEAKRDELKLIK
ncbi:septum formation inhibitor Maf [uncultured Formosa sp.]|uniref:septum formation inhibitor Maf n=1 Tax=uncultured Formosa sp. TaxID=255435 RepID=UPI002606AD7A|nr:septum formation inhibitor Maf [uncultured Formosa sp.]